MKTSECLAVYKKKDPAGYAALMADEGAVRFLNAAADVEAGTVKRVLEHYLRKRTCRSGAEKAEAGSRNSGRLLKR